MAVFKSLAHRPFLLLWLGQTISRLGDSLYQIALAWWVLDLTGSAAALGQVLICAALPTILFALIGGVAVDRLPRPHLMVGADVLRGLLLIALAALAATHQLTIWRLCLASALLGLLNAFFLPAYAALIPEITPMRLRASANALTSLGAEICGVAGPAFGAIVLGRGGAALALALDGASFLAAALCLLPLLLAVSSSASFGAHGPGTEGTEGTEGTDGVGGAEQVSGMRSSLYASVLRDLRDGLRVVAASSWLWMTIGLLALLNLTGRSPIQVALPLLVRERLRAGVDTLGLLYAALALGAMVGAAWAGRVSRPRRRGRRVYRALALVGLATLALGLPIGSPAGMIAIFVLGAALAVANLTWAHIVQDHVPAQVFGRVASITLLGSTSLLPIGFGLAGWSADRLGPAAVFLIGGALTAALAAMGLRSRVIRGLE